MNTTDTSDKPDNNWVEEVGGPVYRSVEAMIAVLQCDYDRIEELREERMAWVTDLPLTPEREEQWAIAYPDEADELAELKEAAGDCESRDEAEQRIQEDALSVEVRSGWVSAGAQEDMRPEEFNILLCTGGPAARIRGELNERGEPVRAWLEVQDWYKPWTQYLKADSDVLLAYARCFYFGEG